MLASNPSLSKLKFEKVGDLFFVIVITVSKDLSFIAVHNLAERMVPKISSANILLANIHFRTLDQ